ncbi:MAG: PAS domain-containing protein, partial [Solirubrobacteraceae bacterium]
MAIEVSGPVLGAIDLIEQLGDAVVVTDLDGKITLFNAAAEELYGYCAAEMIGQSIALLTPEPISEAAELERERVRAGETRRLVGHVLTSTGTACGVELTLSPLRDTGGAIIGSLGVARDVSGRMLRERQLEDISALAAETETVAVVGTDRDGLITLFNRGAEELLGYTAEEVVGRLNGL